MASHGISDGILSGCLISFFFVDRSKATLGKNVGRSHGFMGLLCARMITIKRCHLERGLNTRAFPHLISSCYNTIHSFQLFFCPHISRRDVHFVCVSRMGFPDQRMDTWIQLWQRARGTSGENSGMRSGEGALSVTLSRGRYLVWLSLTNSRQLRVQEDVLICTGRHVAHTSDTSQVRKRAPYVRIGGQYPCLHFGKLHS